MNGELTEEEMRRALFGETASPIPDVAPTQVEEAVLDRRQTCLS